MNRLHDDEILVALNTALTVRIVFAHRAAFERFKAPYKPRERSVAAGFFVKQLHHLTGVREITFTPRLRQEAVFNISLSKKVRKGRGKRPLLPALRHGFH